MKKFVTVFLLALALSLIGLSCAAAEEGPSCNGLRRALEQVPPDSLAYAHILAMIEAGCVRDFVYTGALESARHDHSASLLADGRVLVAGGSTGLWQGPSLASVEVYDPASGTWQPGPSLNYPHGGHTATTLADGRIFVTGGIRPGPVWQATTEMFDPNAASWQVMAPMTYPRSMHSATLLPNGEILVIGGWTGSMTLSHVEAYNPSTNTWRTVGSLLEARQDHSANLLPDGRVLVVGGYRGTWLGTAEIFDPATGTSTPTYPPACHGTSHETVVLADGRIMLVGGACGSGRPGIVAQVSIFDPVTASWQAVAPMAQARFGMTVNRLDDGRVIVIGGGDGDIALASTEIFDPATGAWRAGPPMHDARVVHTTTRLANGDLLVAAGWAIDTVTLNTAELFH
ncbi:MAG: kelch repeat-containing protein [Chloroflexota bacterium]|jgi:hypothetical protein